MRFVALYGGPLDGACVPATPIEAYVRQGLPASCSGSEDREELPGCISSSTAGGPLTAGRLYPIDDKESWKTSPGKTRTALT